MTPDDKELERIARGAVPVLIGQWPNIVDLGALRAIWTASRKAAVGEAAAVADRAADFVSSQDKKLLAEGIARRIRALAGAEETATLPPSPHPKDQWKEFDEWARLPTESTTPKVPYGIEEWQRFVLASEGLGDWLVEAGENYCWHHRKTICLNPDLSNEAIFLHEVAHITYPEPEGQHKNHFHGGNWSEEFSRLVMKYMSRKPSPHPKADAGGWRPIEGAPKDRSFWGWHESYFEPEICRWATDEFIPRFASEQIRSVGYCSYWPPTYWKPRDDVPLPPPPEQEGK